MYKIVFDSDALIKLVKSGLDDEILGKVVACIPEQVFEETVVEGKKGHHADAAVIESFINEGLIRKYKTKSRSSGNLGKGELATRDLYGKIRANAIITDDGAFIRELIEGNVRFLTTGAFIVFSFEKGFISRKLAEDYLSKLRGQIGEKQFGYFKKQLEG